MPGRKLREEFELLSPVIEQAGPIPTEYTCEGRDVSPPLYWRFVPEGTRSFALVVHDPDAPDPRAPKRDWVHWVLFDIPGWVRELPGGGPGTGLPQGAIAGLNDWYRRDYSGPCPPVGRHRYFFELTALDSVLAATRPLTRRELEARMEGHVLGRALLVGTFQKQPEFHVHTQ